MPTSTIQSFEMVKDNIALQHGTFTSYRVTLADGTVGEALKKQGNSFTLGEEVNYTVEQGQYGAKLKIQKPNTFSGGGGFKGNGGANRDSNASFALSYAKDVICATMTAYPNTAVLAPTAGEAIITLADTFYDWLEAKKAAQPAQSQPQTQQSAQGAPAPQQSAQQRPYDNRPDNAQGQRSFAPAQRPSDPTAGDWRSDAQIGLIKRKAQEKGVDAEQECQALYDGCGLNDISKAAASYLIDSLDKM